MMSFPPTVIIDDTIMTLRMLSWQWRHCWPRDDSSVLVFLCLFKKATEILVCYVLDLYNLTWQLPFEGQDVVVFSYCIAKCDSTWSQRKVILLMCSKLQPAWRATYCSVLQTLWHAFNENHSVCLYRTTVINCFCTGYQIVKSEWCQHSSRDCLALN